MNLDGFSLLELLIVMIITTILSSIGISSWRDMQNRNQLSVVTQGVIEFLNKIRLDANFYNENYHIYFIQQDAENWCLATNNLVLNPCQTTLSFIPKYKQIKLIGLSAQPAIIFYGRRSTAKAVTIRLQNRIGESRIIISVPGRIRYCSYRTYLTGFAKC